MRIASGTQTRRIAPLRSSDATTGCRIGQTSTAVDGFGFPDSSRAAAVTAMTGFHAAIVPTTAGMPWVGADGFDMNASGRTIRNAFGWHDSPSSPARSAGSCAPRSGAPSSCRRRRPVVVPYGSGTRSIRAERSP
jgi:hypothetical protein